MGNLISDGFRGCPSCGGQPHVTQSHKRIWKAECVDEACPMIVEVRGATVEDVRQKWNHRPGEEILCERIQQLKAELASVLDVAMARGAQLGYSDDDYLDKYEQLTGQPWEGAS